MRARAAQMASIKGGAGNETHTPKKMKIEVGQLSVLRQVLTTIGARVTMHAPRPEKESLWMS
tara:strand:- start:2386 stop:2571 length:186 start_codon:yes stop_codon:yes gene_type:complete